MPSLDLHWTHRLRTDESAGGSNNLVVHGTAAEAGANPHTGFAVVARIGLERAGYQYSRVPGALQAGVTLA